MNVESEPTNRLDHREQQNWTYLSTVPRTQGQADAIRHTVAELLQKHRMAIRAVSSTPPDFMVEVLSPDERRVDARERVRGHIAAGVRLVWLAVPETRTVMVYTGSMRGVEFDESDSLDGGDALPGFSCKVADLFE